ncbi:MAG: hypothetical protein AAGE52_02005 [Myxococcota bacterium]
MTAVRFRMNDDLKPARFESIDAEGKAFAAKLPWKWILAIALVIVGSAGYYQWRERTRAFQLRSTIEASYQMHVIPVRERVSQFRTQIEDWVQEAAAFGDAPETWADPRLNLAGLHRAQGIYLRIHESQTEERHTIGEAAQTMRPDAIGRCLGLSPMSLKGFYDRLPFLEPEWLDEVREAGDDVLKLRVLDEQLKNRVERDLPLMLDAGRSDYFLLVIQHGDSRREHPVDVFLWDLRSRRQLLRTRAQARGTLIPVRIAIGNKAGGAAPPPPQRSGVVDCSIAAQVRAAAGAETVGVRSAMPVGEVVEPPSEDDTAAEDTATEDTATEDTAAEDTAAEDTAAEDTAAEDTAAENTAAEESDTASDDTASDHASGE